MIHFDSENAQFEEWEEPRKREDFGRPTTILLLLWIKLQALILLQTKADVGQIHFSWDLLLQSPSSVVSDYMALCLPFLWKKADKSNKKHCEEASFLDQRKLAKYVQIISELLGKFDHSKK